MSPNQIRDQLINEWRNLSRQWQTSRAQWHDQKRLEFEKEIWQEFQSTVPKFLDKLGKLNQTIEKTRHEIESKIS